MRIPLPLDGQTWLLSAVTMMVGLDNCDDRGVLTAFEGRLDFRVWYTPSVVPGAALVEGVITGVDGGSLAGGAERLLTRDGLDMTPDHHGELEFTFLQRHFGHMRIEVGGVGNRNNNQRVRQ
jgi:hypothetical protein